MKYAIELKNISKSYQDGKQQLHILKDASLQVKPGEFVAILGPSGSGKSTLLTIAGLLLSPDSGNVIIDGEDTSTVPSKKWNKIRLNKIGFIFQSHHLLSYLKGVDQLNVVLDMISKDKKEEYSKEIPALFEHLGVKHCMNSYPSQMSGGEKQRIAIARAFILQPSLILADEPTASLDSERGRQIVTMMRNEVKRHNTAAIMVTHDERVLDLVDTIYTIQDGKIVEIKK